MLMDDAKVLHPCRLLHGALCDDLEVRQLVVHVERDHVAITIHPKHGERNANCRWRRFFDDREVSPLDRWRYALSCLRRGIYLRAVSKAPAAGDVDPMQLNGRACRRRWFRARLYLWQSR